MNFCISSKYNCPLNIYQYCWKSGEYIKFSDVILIFYLLYEQTKNVIAICQFIDCLQDFQIRSVGVFLTMVTTDKILRFGKFMSNRNSYENGGRIIILFF